MKRLLRGCITSLLILAVAGGVFSPLTAYAEPDASHGGNHPSFYLTAPQNYVHTEEDIVPDYGDKLDLVPVLHGMYSTWVFGGATPGYADFTTISHANFDRFDFPYEMPETEGTTLTFKAGSIIPETMLKDQNNRLLISPTIKASSHMNMIDAFTEEDITTSVSKAEEISGLDDALNNLDEWKELVNENSVEAVPQLDYNNLFYYMQLAVTILNTPTAPDANEIKSLLEPALGTFSANINGDSFTDLYDVLEKYGLNKVVYETEVQWGNPEGSESEMYTVTDTTASTSSTYSIPDEAKFPFHGAMGVEYAFHAYTRKEWGSSADYLYMFHPFNAGVFWVQDVDETIDQNKVLTHYYAKLTLYNCLLMYVSMIDEVDYTNVKEEGNSNFLYVLRDITDGFGDNIPWIQRIYNTNYDNSQLPTVEDMVEDAELDDDKHFTDIDLETVTTVEALERHRPKTLVNPIEKLFYTINNVAVTSKVNRDEVLNDVAVNWEGSLKQDEILDEIARHEHITGSSLYKIEDLPKASDIENSDIKSHPDETSKLDKDVDLSSYIKLGIIHSLQYTPMATNIYTVDYSTVPGKKAKDLPTTTMSFEEFTKRYSSLRKALFIDRSGTSALDYYNLTSTSSVDYKVCTLRDLLYADESDITLYIDTGFYNDETAIAQAKVKLAAHQNDMQDVDNKIRVLLAAYNSLNVNREFTYAVHEFVEEFGQELKYDSKSEVKLSDLQLIADRSLSSLHTFRTQKAFKSVRDLENVSYWINQAVSCTNNALIDESLLKSGSNNSYSMDSMLLLSQTEYGDYVDLSEEQDTTFDNYDSIVLTSSEIDQYLTGNYTFEETYDSSESDEVVVNQYSTITSSYAMRSFAYVSALYRLPRYIALDATVSQLNPVFIASDRLVKIPGVTNDEWYRRQLYNWALVKNLSANLQIGADSIRDLDCPVYMDIFGNILTESGTVVIPAAANATLFPASYFDVVRDLPLLRVYGRNYEVPVTLYGAGTALTGQFYADYITTRTWKINPTTIEGVEVGAVDATTLADTTDTLVEYLDKHPVNWMAYAQIINEVMRGTDIPSLNKEAENLVDFNSSLASRLVAAIKLDQLLDALNTANNNSLLAIPDFTTIDGADYLIALGLKILFLVTLTSCIIMVYRDAVAGDLTFRTFWKCVMSGVLTSSVIVVIPTVFQLTYYSANKLVLEDDAFRILMMNEEKRAVGSEVGLLDTTPYNHSSGFKIQLESLDLPWYKYVESVMFNFSRNVIDDMRTEANLGARVQGNNDVVYENDGVYITADKLFDSMGVDYTFNAKAGEVYGLYLTESDVDQSMSFYSPYYVFLNTILANINEYNVGREGYLTQGMNYTEKIMAGNRVKTVGVGYRYFSSVQFLEDDSDIMRIGQMYRDSNLEGFAQQIADKYDIKDFNPQPYEDKDGNVISDPYLMMQHALDETDQISKLTKSLSREYQTMYNRWNLNIKEETTFKRQMLYTDEDIKKFQNTLWWNEAAIPDIERRIEALDRYARQFVTDNKDLMLRVTDETFCKLYALYMAIKYNQVFGISTANSLEIYGMDSEDLVRMCMVEDKDVAMATSQSFTSFVFNYGDVPTIIMVAFLMLVLTMGAFLKPLCVILVFLSVFLSIWVFRVLLQRKSANLYGYVITVLLLCATNLGHAVILKFGVWLPSIPFINAFIRVCIMCVLQIGYLGCLFFVVARALFDWYNLGYNEYKKDHEAMKKLMGRHADPHYLDGSVKHHENNWDHYTDLIDRQRHRTSEEIVK